MSVVTILIGVICAVAVVPFGCVAGWARSVIVVLCVSITWLSVVLTRMRADDVCVGSIRLRDVMTRAWIVAACCLGVWIVLQAVPLPFALVRMIHPFARDMFEPVLGNPKYARIGFDAYTIRSTAILWLAYGLLGATCARCLRGKLAVSTFLLMVAGIGAFEALFGIALKGSGVWADNPFLTARLTGTFTSGNSFGGFLALTLVSTFGAMLWVVPCFVEEVRRKGLVGTFSGSEGGNRTLLVIYLCLCFVLQGVALLLSGSRGAIGAGLVAVAFICLWFVSTSRDFVRGGTLRVLLVGFSLILVFGVGGGYAIALARLQKTVEQPVVEAVPRLAIWSAAVHLFLAHPWGVGPGCFGEAFSRFQPPGFGPSRVYHAHNDFLQMLCELGVVGFICLIVLLWLGARRAMTVARTGSRAYSIWLWRGALGAVLAGLIHACLDFNLSSRPGVSVIFCALLGIVLGYGERDEERVEGRRGTTVSRRVFVALTVCLLVIGADAVRFGMSSYLMETGRVAAGSAPDRYFWLKIMPAAAERGLERLRQSIRLAPQCARAHYTLGTGYIKLFDQKVERVARENAEFALGIDKNEAEAIVRSAMGSERVAAYARARGSFESAVELSPWNSFYRAALSRSLAESASAAEDIEEARRLRRAAVDEASLSVRLAPNSAKTLAHACTTLTLCLTTDIEEPGPDMSELLRTWGRRALWLRGGIDESIISSWHAAGMPVLQMLRGRRMPPEVLWEAYRVYEAASDPVGSIEALKTLESACEQAPDDALFSSRQEKQGYGKYRMMIVEHRSKWLLRLGRWSPYRGYSDERRMAYTDRIRSQVQDEEGDVVSPLAQYLRLSAVENRIGLDERHSLLLCQLKASRGDVGAASLRLAEIALSLRNKEIEQLRKFALSENEFPRDNYAMQIAQARVLAWNGKARKSSDVLRRLVMRDDVPLKLAHRIRFLLGETMLGLGESGQGQEMLVEAAESCPFDPDPLNALVKSGAGEVTVRGQSGYSLSAGTLLRRLRPAYELGTEFLGGKIVLHGIGVEPDVGSRAGDIKLQLYWRFWASVPSDLEVVVSTYHSGGYGRFSRSTPFSVCEPLFAGGQPAVGMTIVMEIRLPLRSRVGDRMLVGLRRKSERRWILSAENLSYVEIWDWGKYLSGDENQDELESAADRS